MCSKELMLQNANHNYQQLNGVIQNFEQKIFVEIHEKLLAVGDGYAQ